MKEITINIFESANEPGYMYNIYTGSPEEVAEGLDSVDGGLCTGSLSDALGMAKEQEWQSVMGKRKM